MSMEKTLLSPDDVLERIGAASFRNVSKDKLIAFVSALPEMDKETAIKCIEQFPEFRNYANDIICQLKDISFELLKSQKESLERTIVGYQKTLDSLAKCLERPNLSERDEHYIIERMIEVADKMAELQQSNEAFLKHALHVLASLAGGALAIGGAILGVRFIGKNNGN